MPSRPLRVHRALLRYLSWLGRYAPLPLAWTSRARRRFAGKGHVRRTPMAQCDVCGNDRQGLPGYERRPHHDLRQLRMRDPGDGADLRSLRLQDRRAWGRGCRQDVLLRPLRAAPGRSARPRRLAANRGGWNTARPAIPAQCAVLFGLHERLRRRPVRPRPPAQQRVTPDLRWRAASCAGTPFRDRSHRRWSARSGRRNRAWSSRPYRRRRDRR